VLTDARYRLMFWSLAAGVTLAAFNVVHDMLWPIPKRGRR